MPPPERRPAALPRISKAPNTGHPARPVPVEAVSDPERESDTPGPATPPGLRKKEKKVIFPTYSTRLDPQLIEEMKIFAIQNNALEQDVVSDAIREYLARYGRSNR